MDIQSLCIGRKVGELSEVALGLLEDSLHDHSPPASTPSLSPTSSHRAIKPTFSKARHTKMQSSHKKRSAVKHQSFVRITPKLDTGAQARRRRSRSGEPEYFKSSSTDRSYRVGVPYSSEVYDSYGMTDIDLMYARMTPSERVAFKIPGTSVFKVSKATPMDDFSSTPTHECFSCGGRGCCTGKKDPTPKDTVMELSESPPRPAYAPKPPNPACTPVSPLPGFVRMLEHASGFHWDLRAQQYV